jgi:cystathionine gamma-synthase
MTHDLSTWQPETLAITAGRAEQPGGPLNVPPTFASTYRDGGVVGYGRWGNPTWARPVIRERTGGADSRVGNALARGVGRAPGRCLSGNACVP